MTRRNAGRSLMVSSAWLCACASLSWCGELRLPAVFSDHMVLQRGGEVPVWGWAAAGERVTVEIAGRRASAVAGADGRWRARLAEMPAGGPHEMKVAGGGGTLTVSDVLVGEVWLCSGQSNMAMTVSRSLDAENEIASADDDGLRMFKVAANSRPHAPVDDVKGDWRAATPETVGGFSATAYFFGRRLRKDVGVPVGLINSSWGGTCVEAWTSREVLKTVVPAEEYAKMEAQVRGHEEQRRRSEEALRKWTADRKARKKVGRRPRVSAGQNIGGALFNGMIAPLVPYAIRGATWYQGERNSASHEMSFAYRVRLPALIGDWRARWGRGDFPFISVQLPSFETNRAWPIIRESFLETLKVPNTGMAIAIDVGMARDIHPKNKQAVGERLAIWALGTVYVEETGKDVVHSGPLFRDMRVEGGKALVRFDHAGEGLMTAGKEGLKPVRATPGAELAWFEVAGADRRYVKAEAKIVALDTVEVRSAGVPSPVAVRYAWANNPEGCNLYNSAGLPASPFRTDRWETAP